MNLFVANAPAGYNNFKRGRPILRIRIFLVLLPLALASCQRSETVKALQNYRGMREQAIDVTEQFFSAGMKGDVAAMREVATDSAVAKFRKGKGVDQHIRGAATTLNPTQFEWWWCDARLWFTYSAGGEEMSGFTHLTMFNQRLQVVSFGLMVHE